MLHSRDNDSIRRVLQAQRRLMESDERERSLRRHANTPEDHARAAVETLRRVGSGGAHDVGVALHKASPEGHQKLQDDMQADDPRRATVAVAPHLHQYRAFDGKLTGMGLSHPDVAKLQVGRAKALRQIKMAANDNNRSPGSFFKPEKNEEPTDHLRRAFRKIYQTGSTGESYGRNGFSETFLNREDAGHAERDALHHHAYTHTVRRRGPQGTTITVRRKPS